MGIAQSQVGLGAIPCLWRLGRTSSLPSLHFTEKEPQFSFCEVGRMLLSPWGTVRDTQDTLNMDRKVKQLLGRGISSRGTNETMPEL